MRSLTIRVLVSSAAVFAVWAAARIAVLRHVRATYNYDDRWLSVVTDFEIHTLDPRFGWDLAAIPVLAGLSVLFMRNQSVIGRVAAFAGTTALSSVLALGMALFPSAVLGGHLHTRLKTYVGQSVAFAACGIGLMLLAIGFDFIVRRRLRRS